MLVFSSKLLSIKSHLNIYIKLSRCTERALYVWDTTKVQTTSQDRHIAQRLDVGKTKAIKDMNLLWPIQFPAKII